MDAQNILCIKLNNNNSLFIIGTNTGFKIFNLKKYNPIVDRSFAGGVRLIDILDTSNILGIVTVDKPTTLFIWNEAIGSIISKIETDKYIYDVKVVKNYIAIVFSDEIRLYKLGKLELVKKLGKDGSYNNNIYLTENMLIYPSDIIGTISIYSIDTDMITNIEIHNSNIHNMFYINDFIVSVSISGTTIKVYDIINNQLYKEFRRGITTSKIYNCIISDDKRFLMTSGDSGTIHIYNLLNDAENKKSLFSSIDFILPEYFSSTWSCIKYYDYENIRLPHIATFEPGNSNHIYFIFSSGKIIKYNIDLKNKNITMFDNYVINI